MPVVHLTDIVVSRLKSPGTYFDETTPAFGIRVGKNRKTWIVMRRMERQRVRVTDFVQSIDENSNALTGIASM
jgi:hypothetical protein